MSDTQSLVVLGAILLIFGWIGLRRGFKAELGTLALILGSRELVEWKGDRLVALVNGLYMAARFVLKGGLTAKDPGRVFAAVRNMRPLISHDFQPTFLLTVSILFVILAYLIGRLKIFRAGSRILGALLGFVNGYIVLRLFLPLLPEDLPAPLTFLAGQAPAARSPEVQAAVKPLRGLMSEYGQYVTIVVVGIILYLVVSSIQPEKKSES